MQLSPLERCSWLRIWIDLYLILKCFSASFKVISFDTLFWNIHCNAILITRFPKLARFEIICFYELRPYSVVTPEFIFAIWLENGKANKFPSRCFFFFFAIKYTMNDDIISVCLIIFRCNNLLKANFFLSLS